MENANKVIMLGFCTIIFAMAVATSMLMYSSIRQQQRVIVNYNSHREMLEGYPSE